MVSKRSSFRRSGWSVKGQGPGGLGGQYRRSYAWRSGGSVESQVGDQIPVV